METIKPTFGNWGSKFFASLNVLQLIAWVAVLNAQGAIALLGLNLGISFPVICIILAVLVSIWVFIGIQRSSNITSIVMIVLTILLILLTFKLFGFNPSQTLLVKNSLSFWNIFEISIAMPISWLPVISDYTKDVKTPKKATALSAIAYTIASLWMYFIGIEVVNMGTVNISQAILISGLGVPGVIILVLSTVTTNFLATNSAGESAKAIFNKLNPKLTGVIVSILSALIAISGIMNHYINFLYLISSVFAPMASVLIVSFYLSDNNNTQKDWYWNLFTWLCGFCVYQIASSLDSIFLGPTLLAIIVSALLTYIRIVKHDLNIKRFFNDK